MAWTPKTYRYWYDALIDWILANPQGTMEDAAIALDKHVVTVRMVANSDMFKARMEARRRSLNAALETSIASRLLETADVVLETLVERVRDDRDTKKIPLPVLSDIADKTLSKLGYSPKSLPGGGVGQDNNTSVTVIVPVTAAVLQESRDALRALEVRRAEIGEARQDVGGSAVLPTPITLDAVKVG